MTTAVDQTQLSDSACFTVSKQTIECIFLAQVVCVGELCASKCIF